MPRKKRIAILVVSILLVIFIILGILGFLFFKTDIFTPTETLFAKYFMQNFDIVEIFKSENTLEIENSLNNSKYISEIEGKIEYTENIGTSDENKNNPINDVGIKIKSNIDKLNNYNYKDISIGTDDEDLIKFEYFNQDQIYGIRLNGIKQFVSIDNSENSEISQGLKINNLNNLNELLSVFNFTEEEKINLQNTYLGIIQSNVSKDRYHKQLNSLITVNNKDVNANAYYITITIEEYNNLCMKILEQLSEDEIILSKIDLIEDKIKEIYSDYEQEESLREEFINSINDKIGEIQNSNIGNEELKITVYESDKKIVRTSIEKATNKITIDLYDKSSIKISNVEISENTNEYSIKIEKKNEDTEADLLVEFQKSQNNEIINDVQLSYNKIFENDKLTKRIQLSILNEKYEAIFDIADNVEIVEEFENEITLDTDNLKLDDLPEEQIEVIKTILNENIQGQISKLNSVVNLEEYAKMFKNLNLLNKNSIELPTEGEVTEIEKKRFNSQFEFFVSENLTTDNIKDLMEVVKNNFEDMKVLLKNGEIQYLDIEKLNSSQESSEYIKDISEILLFIKENSYNVEKQEDTLKFIEKNNSNNYDVSIQYDDNGLTRLIRIKIQER